jgi:tRNA(Ile)-lysidine synthase
MDPDRRPRLTPAIADVRRAVRSALESIPRVEPALPSPAPPDSKNRLSVPIGSEALVLVALSGGPDSLALAAATAFEARRAGIRAGAVVVDHALQPGSADVAASAVAQALALGLDPVSCVVVSVGGSGGPEAAARTARYAALESTAQEVGASVILLGHTLDDQAETVLLGLARGSGPTSLHGMSPSTSSGASASSGTGARSPTSESPGTTGVLYVRPLLAIRRATTVRFCIDSDLEPWIDPQNSDEAFTRVRVRNTVLPMLERELGPGVAEALARTADQLREDSDALDHFAEEIAEELADLAESGISLPVRALASNPPALRQRLIRLAVESEFHVSLSRALTLEVSRLVTNWHGQKALDLPGVRVERKGGLLIFTATE